MSWLINIAFVLFMIAVMGVWVVLPWPGAIALALLLVAWLWLTRRGRQALSVAHVGISTLRQRET